MLLRHPLTEIRFGGSPESHSTYPSRYGSYDTSQRHLSASQPGDEMAPSRDEKSVIRNERSAADDAILPCLRSASVSGRTERISSSCRRLSNNIFRRRGSTVEPSHRFGREISSPSARIAMFRTQWHLHIVIVPSELCYSPQRGNTGLRHRPNGGSAASRVVLELPIYFQNALILQARSTEEASRCG